MGARKNNLNMKSDYTGDQSNIGNSSYGGYSKNYGGPNYINNSSYRYGGSPGPGQEIMETMAMDHMGIFEKNKGPQRTLKDYIFLIRERIWYLVIVFFIIFLGSILIL